jgi:hypothetical protein
MIKKHGRKSSTIEVSHSGTQSSRHLDSKAV